MLFRAIICMLIFIKKAIYKRFYFIFATFCALFTIFSVSFSPIPVILTSILSFFENKYNTLIFNP